MPRAPRPAARADRPRCSAYAIKASVGDPCAESFAFAAHKTMYGGRRIAAGDTVFVFAGGTDAGRGLAALGLVTCAEPLARTPGLARQTPRVSLAVRRTALARRPLGRAALTPFADWNDGRPETELNFKFYRQATDKVVGLSDEAAAFLREFF